MPRRNKRGGDPSEAVDEKSSSSAESKEKNGFSHDPPASKKRSGSRTSEKLDTPFAEVISAYPDIVRFFIDEEFETAESVGNEVEEEYSFISEELKSLAFRPDGCVEIRKGKKENPLRDRIPQLQGS